MTTTAPSETPNDTTGRLPARTDRPGPTSSFCTISPRVPISSSLRRLFSFGDGPLLLRKPVGQLRGRSDLRLERGTTLRRKRSVRERCELRDVRSGGVFVSTASHHRNRKGNRESRGWVQRVLTQ